MSIEAIGAAAPLAVDVELPVDSSKSTGLHSPPESNNAMDVDGSDSELSDLDEVAGKLNAGLTNEHKDEPNPEPKDEDQPSPDDIGEVEPDHWSGNVPVFKPTMKQFQDFKLFVWLNSSHVSVVGLFGADGGNLDGEGRQVRHAVRHHQNHTAAGMEGLVAAIR
jgi:hypothetical protein